MKQFLGVVLFAGIASGQQQGCYDADKNKLSSVFRTYRSIFSDKEVVEEEPCECHVSCLACGYYEKPIQANDCISCAEEGYELRVEFEEDGTGYCVQEVSKRLSVSMGMLISTYLISL